MGYKTKLFQDLCTTSTEIHEEVIQFVLNEDVFYQNVRNLRKSSLEAVVYVLLMKQRGKLPSTITRNQMQTKDFIAIIEENYLRLQTDSETFGWVLSAFALTMLGEENTEMIRSPLETLLKKFDIEYDELPLYYDVLRTLLTLSKERPELNSIFGSLDGEKMIRRLASESKVVKMKALGCLHTMVEFNSKLFELWLQTLLDTKLMVEHRSFMLHQLLETLLRIKDNREQILLVIQCHQIWPIIKQSITSNVTVCRKEAIATIQYIIGYAKHCGQDVHGVYFSWSQDVAKSEQLTNAWQSFVIIVEALNETQTHLILPALELIEKVSCLHCDWKNLLLRLILLHENPRVANYGIQYSLKQRSFDNTDLELEKQFLTTFNQIALFENIAEIINGLRQYYSSPEAVEYVLISVKNISWNSVPFYCMVKMIHDFEITDETGPVIHLKSLSNSVKVCQDIKNVSLRYITVLLLLRTITRYVNRCRKLSQPYELLEVLQEIEKLSPIFSISPERFHDESGSTFCDAITDEAFSGHLHNVLVSDTFFIKEILIRRIVNAVPVEQEKLLRTLSQCNLTIYLNLLSALPHNLRKQFLTAIPDATGPLIVEIKRAMKSNVPITHTTFSALRELTKCVRSTRDAAMLFGEGWDGIYEDLKTLLNERLMSFNYTQTVAVETIQIAHLLTVELGDSCYAKKFFHAISLNELKDTFRRDQSTEPSIDQIYAMISDIFLQYSQSDHSSDGSGFATENNWSRLISLLDVGNIDVLTNVLDILYTASGTGDSVDKARLVVVDRSYKEILNYRKSDHFMKLVKKFIIMLLRPYTKMTDESDLDSVEMDPTVAGYVGMFIEQSSTIYGLANEVFENLFQIPIPILLNWSILGKVLLQGMIFGDVLKRDQKIENEVIDQCGLDIPFTQYPRYFSQADGRVRVLCVMFLHRIVKSNHPDAVLFLLKLERMLMERFGQITKAKERYYADSITHRQKLRIVQALCVVLKLTGTKPYPLLDVMLHETNQPNINYLIELIVADSTIDTLTIANALRNEKVKVSGIQSVFVILWLRCCQTNSLDEKYIYLLLPWTMAQNFSTRLYAQITIKKLIAKFFPQPAQDGPLKEIYAAVNSYLRQGNVERNIEKCMKDFRFNSVFDYGNLLTMENIFHNIPKVSVTPSEDVIGTLILKECLQSLGLSANNLGQPLAFEDLQSEKRENLFLAQSFGGADFVQRKIVPLKKLEPSQELLLGLPEKLCLKKMESMEGLIVVASLVNRAPNLGGLARTCEIFAVKQFVINSLQDIDNKEFQALSMTAEKWLNIGELKAHKIVEYLEEMKSKGYSIVGAEQTTGSKPIQQLQFPKKSILVLGHEKNGLPAEIIRHLDLIGEIPQFGVVRSLNVHVTGAIFMWEYAIQHNVAKLV